MSPYLLAGTAASFLALFSGTILVALGVRWRRGFSGAHARAHLVDPALVGLAALFAILPAVGIESIHNMEETYLLDYPGLDFLTASLRAIHFNHFPLYPAFLKIASLASTQVAFYRALSALAFALGLIPFYGLVRAPLGRRAARLATLLYAASPMSLYYAKIVEPYSFLLAATALFAWAFARHVKEPEAPVGLLAASGALGCYLHQFFALVPAAATLALLMTANDRRRAFRAFAPALGAIAILASPLVLLQAGQFPIKAMTFPPQKLMQVYWPYEMNPVLTSLRDFVCLFGLQASALKGFVFPAGLGLGALFLWGTTTRGKPRELAVLLVTGRILAGLLLVVGAFYHLLFSRELGGWYPLWRHGIVLVPFVFLSLATLFDRAIKGTRGLAVPAIFALVFLSQIVSDRAILFGRVIPDSRAAWGYISPRAREGDALIATPAPLFLTSTMIHYIPVTDRFRARDARRSPKLATMVLGGAGIAPSAPWTGAGATYPVKRIWNVRYDFRFFGLYPEFNDFGERLLDEEFSSWRVVEDRSFAHLAVRLLEAPSGAAEGEGLFVSRWRMADRDVLLGLLKEACKRRPEATGAGVTVKGLGGMLELRTVGLDPGGGGTGDGPPGTLAAYLVPLEPGAIERAGR